LKLAKEKGYILMILGKGDENYIEYCDTRINYSDREFIKKILM